MAFVISSLFWGKTLYYMELLKQKDELKKNEGSLCIFRCGIFILLSLIAVLSLAILGVNLDVLIGKSSLWNPLSVPTQCKILSSSVDLRASKVCEQGLLNYKARHVFYSSDRKKFRCHYDYYWASVFKVEYSDYSGTQRLALAEAPDEALPPNCRPGFDSAWLAKDKFKVNETYDCWYTVGLSKINIYPHGIFNSQAKDPSLVEMLKRFIFLSTGFSTSLLSLGMVGLSCQWKLFLRQLCATQKMPSPSRKAIRFKRFWFFIAYFSFMGWLGLLCGKGLGLLHIL